MRKMFRVTYSVVTPESSERGDESDGGFMLPGGWQFSRNLEGFQAEDYSMTLREAVTLCHPQQDSGRWFSEVDGRTDYRKGSVETRDLHPPHAITAASYNRLKRLLGV